MSKRHACGELGCDICGLKNCLARIAELEASREKYRALLNASYARSGELEARAERLVAKFSMWALEMETLLAGVESGKLRSWDRKHIVSAVEIWVRAARAALSEGTE